MPNWRSTAEGEQQSYLSSQTFAWYSRALPGPRLQLALPLSWPWIAPGQLFLLLHSAAAAATVLSDVDSVDVFDGTVTAILTRSQDLPLIDQSPSVVVLGVSLGSLKGWVAGTARRCLTCPSQKVMRR